MSKQHIVKSVFWLTTAEIIYSLSGYAIHAGVGRILGPEGYGRYGLVITLTTMIIMLIGWVGYVAQTMFERKRYITGAASAFVLVNMAVMVIWYDAIFTNVMRMINRFF